MRLDPHLLNAIRFLTVLPVPATGDAQGLTGLRVQ
jgi:adenosylcobinamide-GDP ribazoletransferase